MSDPNADKADKHAEKIEAFSKLDSEFIRVLEDVIDVLIASGTLRMTDLPIEAQRKLSERKSSRARLNVLNLLDDDSVI